MNFSIVTLWKLPPLWLFFMNVVSSLTSRQASSLCCSNKTVWLKMSCVWCWWDHKGQDAKWFVSNLSVLTWWLMLLLYWSWMMAAMLMHLKFSSLACVLQQVPLAFRTDFMQIWDFFPSVSFHLCWMSSNHTSPVSSCSWAQSSIWWKTSVIVNKQLQEIKDGMMTFCRKKKLCCLTLSSSPLVPNLVIALSNLDMSRHPASLELLKICPRTRLKMNHKHLFKSKRSLLDDLGLLVCDAGVVHGKEFLETCAAATAIHNFKSFDDFPHTLLADLAAGHGLLGWSLLILAKELGFQKRTVVCADCRKPPSDENVLKAMRKNLVDTLRWSHTHLEAPLTTIVPSHQSLSVSVHACGTLSNASIEMAMRHEAPLALAPCCHTIDKAMRCKPHQLSGMTVDAVRRLVEEEKKRHREISSDSARLDSESVLANVVDQVRYNTLQNCRAEETMLPVKFTAQNHLLLTKPLVTTEFDMTSKDSQKTFSKPALAERRMPPLILLTENLNEMTRLATMCNVQNTESLIAQQTPWQRSPKHFSLHLAVWLSAPGNKQACHLPFDPSEDLQSLANQICNGQGMVCFAEKDGDVIPAKTSNCQS